MLRFPALKICVTIGVFGSLPSLAREDFETVLHSTSLQGSIVFGMDSLEANGRRVFASSGDDLGQPAVWILPVDAEAPPEAFPSLTYNGFSADPSHLSRSFVAEASGKLFVNLAEGIRTFEPDGAGGYTPGELFALSEEGEPRNIVSLKGSGDILFANHRNRFGNDGMITILRTTPTLRIEQEIEEPGALAGYGDQLAVLGDLFLVSRQGESRDDAILSIYRRDGEPETPWQRVNQLDFDIGGSQRLLFDTDGNRVVVVHEVDSRQVVEIFEDAGEGFTGVFSQSIGGIPGATVDSQTPLVDVAIDGDFLVAGADRVDREPFDVSSLIPWIRKDGTWLVQASVDLPGDSLSVLTLADGVAYAAMESDLYSVKLVDRPNQRPFISSPPVEQVVRGRMIRERVEILDDGDAFQIEAVQLPSWLALQEENGGWYLKGTVPGTGDPEPVGIKVTDEGNLSDFQSFEMTFLDESDLPVVSGQSEAQEVSEGREVVLSVEVSGPGPFRFQWFKNDEPIPGETSGRLVLNNVVTGDEGRYLLRISNAVGEVSSEGILVSVLPADRFGGDWPMFGGGPTHQGLSPSSLGTHLFVPMWTRSMGGDYALNAPVIADGKVFVTPRGFVTVEAEVKSFAADTGEEIWSRPIPFSVDGATDSGAFFGGRFFLQEAEFGDLVLRSLNGNSGEELWSTFTRSADETTGSVVPDQSGVYYPSGGFGDVGIGSSSLDGTFRFHVLRGYPSRWTPSLSSGSVYVWANGNFEEFSAETGTSEWLLNYDWPFALFDFHTVPVIEGKQAVIIRPTEMISLDLEKRSVQWTRSFDESSGLIRGVPSIQGAKIFVISGQSVIVLDRSTGMEAGRFDLGSGIVSEQPLLTNDHLIASTATETKIYSLESETLQQVLPVGGLLAYANGSLVVCTSDGQVHSFFANDTPDFVGNVLPDATEDIDYHPVLPVSHDDAGEILTFRKVAGPDWLEVASDGVVTGLFGNIPAQVETLVVEVSDGVTPRVEQTFSLTMIAVNDPPEVREAIADLVAEGTAAPMTISLDTAFNDPDPGDSLTYQITSNSNPGLFRELPDEAFTGSDLILHFEPYQWGAAELTLRATDQEGIFVEQSFTVTLPKPMPPAVVQEGEILLNRRTGLLEQRVTITNNGQRAIGGFELAVGGLENGYGLFGVTGDRLQYATPVTVGGTVSLTLEYYSSQSREIPTPELETSAILPANTDLVEPSEVSPDRISRLDDGSVLLEFSSVPGKRYQIQYSLDMVTWNNTPVVVTANASRTPWLDQGLPKTNCHPRDCRMRLYRVQELAGEVEK